MRGFRALFGLMALGALSATISPDNAVANQTCRSKKDCAAKGARWVAREAAESAIGQTAVNGASRAARRARDAVQRQRRCRNTQGGNNANSTAAVRSC